MTETIQWRTVRGPAADARIIAETSPRRTVQYQLLSGGGLRWIRRIRRVRGREIVEESPATRAAVANARWPEVIGALHVIG
ncbi:hypothetical protein [Actinomadura parmotrematis]|uniref:Uncharacterized protein n=1 Tax=Actinomadura parmotrematis TaxID=2864039 RepID=A0ABS7FWW2_9ACTN|nr:hypothetical protein [Actinomadura parmotrematis]MBW8484660.1 hypothetical protein [Actinomadura parmotrematis]